MHLLSKFQLDLHNANILHQKPMKRIPGLPVFVFCDLICLESQEKKRGF